MNAHQKESHQSQAGMVAQHNIVTSILPENDFDCVTFSLLVAHAALRGHTLKQVSSGYTISSCGVMFHFGDLPEVFATLRKMGVKLFNQ
jgi:hypothetical protein